MNNRIISTRKIKAYATFKKFLKINAFEPVFESTPDTIPCLTYLAGVKQVAVCAAVAAAEVVDAVTVTCEVSLS